MAEPHDPRYAERMFPAPADPGIARPNRATSSVLSGTDTARSGDYKGELWYQGSGRIGERPVASIVIYPPTQGMTTQGDPFEPVKIGVLIDMDLGHFTADLMDPIILAVEDALNEGVYDRPVEIVTVDARGLPRENPLLKQE
jgi:branched-chain amino acid transport system substrate-binding protein